MGGGRETECDPVGRDAVSDGIDFEALLFLPKKRKEKKKNGSSVKPVMNKVTQIQASWLYSPPTNPSKVIV